MFASAHTSPPPRSSVYAGGSRISGNLCSCIWHLPQRETAIATRSKAVQALPKLATGIEGFDQLSLGGLPRNRTTLVMGGPGAGKTVFALQCLVNAARRQRTAGIFVAFEESPAPIIANGATFDWGLPAWRASGCSS